MTDATFEIARVKRATAVVARRITTVITDQRAIEAAAVELIGV